MLVVKLEREMEATSLAKTRQGQALGIVVPARIAANNF